MRWSWSNNNSKRQGGSMTPNVGKAIAGGFVGTILLTLMMRFVAPVMTGQRIDMPGKLGDMTGMGPIAGMIMHFLIGSVIFGLIYVFVLFRFLPRASGLKGAQWRHLLAGASGCH